MIANFLSVFLLVGCLFWFLWIVCIKKKNISLEDLGSIENISLKPGSNFRNPKGKNISLIAGDLTLKYEYDDTGECIYISSKHRYNRILVFFGESSEVTSVWIAGRKYKSMNNQWAYELLYAVRKTIREHQSV